ncbi:MAG: FAD-dependent oxidoreductase [bacterium]|nr:FAD-dependent oxidoreductase [bacterium]
MNAKVKIVADVARDTRLFEFELLKPVQYQPGQSFRLTLADGSHRFFSIANSPKKSFVTTVTRKGITPFKKALWSLAVGAKVDVSSIAGVFLLPEKQNQNLVFIAGGIGITPFISMIRFALENKKKFDITLLFLNPDIASAPFLEELSEYAEKFQNFHLNFIQTKKNARLGREALKQICVQIKNPLFYIAGPVQMVNSIFQDLVGLRVRPDHIRTEEFTGY